MGRGTRAVGAWRCGLAVIGLLPWAGCATTAVSDWRMPWDNQVVEEYRLPPPDDPRYSQTPTYPKQALVPRLMRPPESSEEHLPSGPRTPLRPGPGITR